MELQIAGAAQHFRIRAVVHHDDLDELFVWHAPIVPDGGTGARVRRTLWLSHSIVPRNVHQRAS